MNDKVDQVQTWLEQTLVERLWSDPAPTRCLTHTHHTELTLCTLRSLAPASAAARPEGWCWIPGGPPGGPPPVGRGGGMGGGTAMGGGGPGGGGGAGAGAGTAAEGGATESMAGWPAETGGPGEQQEQGQGLKLVLCLQ